MFRTTSSFDKLLDKATSHLLLEPDWPTTIQICDLIRQTDVLPKQAMGAIKKKLESPNPHCVMYTLLVLESIVKNCGSGIHNEVASKETCEMFRELVKTTSHENVRQKILELLQAWAFAFRKQPKYRAVLDIGNIMKAEGYVFPVLNESDAMFMADTAPEWSDGPVCHRCRVQFGIMQRKHHCRACGQVFCAQCSQHTATLPKFGYEKEVRVCDGCFDTLNKPAVPPTSAKGSVTATAGAATAAEGDLPAEYVTSSLAQQNQSPPRKTEEELREEEELQLALALSQSEAEHKEKEKKRITSAAGRSYSPSPVANRSPSPKAEDTDPELTRYLNRSYWEQRQGVTSPDAASPSAPIQHSSTKAPAMSSPPLSPQIGNEREISDDPEMDNFVAALKSQVEIFVNRMKSNSSRGRSIANDSSVQTLFMNITAMHSRLLRYIQQQDDGRLRYEGLQDKLSQVKDARAALDALREEHRDQMRREAEEAERQRQLQMAHKLEIMRKKKQEYLQYQRQLALQRIQEQEREMQMRQEQQKQQYLMGTASQYGYMGSPVHMQGGMPPPQYNPAGGAPYPQGYPQYVPQQPNPGMMPPPGMQQMGQPPQMGAGSQGQMMGPPPPPPPQPLPGQMPGQQQQSMQVVSSAGPPPGLPQGIPQQQLPPQAAQQSTHQIQVPSAEIIPETQSQTAELISFD